MKKIEFTTEHKKMLADTVTPVSLYLKFRDKFCNSLLLESSDYMAKENSYSYICLQPILNFKLQNKTVTINNSNGKQELLSVTNKAMVPSLLTEFINSIKTPADQINKNFNGLFGYSNYDAVQYFDTIEFDPGKKHTDIPDLYYSFYKYLIIINHFKNELFIIENLQKGEKSDIDTIESIINSQNVASFRFSSTGEEETNMTDDEYKKLVTLGKHHCQQGDVFQIVFSRKFSQKYRGDDFNVYRSLRSINPSPYLFYFDYGNFRIFGSSPEAQIVIKDKFAKIFPIAGTYKRTGDDLKDSEEAIRLAKDSKENQEHVMLVDLARNDLSRHTKDVRVVDFKEIQYFSHVIHLVSKVEGRMENSENNVRVFADTFPAGTLSGAPKYKAMELIDKYENQNRGFYGGAIGMISLSGDINMAIMIRSFLSRDNTLFYQAGAGIVINSVEENELKEVNNKLAALKKAILNAKNI
ncbi:anthranilate synthase component I family protein [Bacteroidota bacterium]